MLTKIGKLRKEKGLVKPIPFSGRRFAAKHKISIEFGMGFFNSFSAPVFLHISHLQSPNK